MATLTLPRFAAGSKDVDGAGTGQASFACAEAVKERALRALAWTKVCKQNLGVRLVGQLMSPVVSGWVGGVDGLGDRSSSNRER